MMNGCTIPYTPIAVDFWKVRQLQRVRLFFLSHVHLDPSCGITSSWSMPIYCSPISKKLLLQRFQLNQDVVHALELNVPHIIPITSNGNEEVTMTVTLIDANHCPGSVMFFFDGYFGRILYTGNFRYTENMMNKSPFCDIMSKPIDVLYMDNRYCSPKCNFPSREVAKREIITTMEQHPQEKVVIGLRNLGKEDLLIAIASHFGTTIKVSEERYKTLELLNAHEQFSVVDSNSRVEVVPMVEITRQNMDTWNKDMPTIAIIPTAIFTALGDFPFHGQKDMFVVPYSDHCSYLELHRFVSAVKPKSIIPIVKADVRDPLTSALLDRTSVECFLDYLDKTPMTNYHIPPAVLELMNQTPSRGGSSRKAGAARKTVAGTRLTKTITKSKKGIENTPNVSDPVSSATTVPLEPKTKPMMYANHSIMNSVKCNVSEKPTAELSSAQSGASQDCTHVVKSKGLTTKLIRCASSDHLSSSYHRPHIKLRANRVASPDLRMQLKRKANTDLKRLSIGMYSNLVRTHRVRLCNAHLCRTLCHSSKNCKSVPNASLYQTPEWDERVLELNKGEKTVYHLTEDIQKNFDKDSGTPDTNSESSPNHSNRDSPQEQPVCNFPISVNNHYVCQDSVAHDIGNRLINSTSPSYGCRKSPEEMDAIDLRSKGPGMSSFSQMCVNLAFSAPQVGKRNDLQETVYPQKSHCQGTELRDLGVDPTEINLRVITSSNISSKVSSSSSPQMLYANTAISLDDHCTDFRHAAAMLQRCQERDQLVNKFADSAEQYPWSPSFSHTSTNGTIEASPTQDEDRTKHGLCLESTMTSATRSAVNYSEKSDSALYNQSPPIHVPFVSFDGDRYSTGVSRTFTDKCLDLTSGGHQLGISSIGESGGHELNPKRGVQDSADLSGAVCYTEAKIAKTDTRTTVCRNDTSRDELNSRLCCSGKTVLHSDNQFTENGGLAPKKNWKHRFRLAQLHKGHQENKWLKMEQNGLLLTNGTNGISRT